MPSGSRVARAPWRRPRRQSHRSKGGDTHHPLGFTLLELIIVVAVIGILATIALPALRNLPRRANEAALKTDLRTMRDVIDQYYGDQGKYPPTLEELVESGMLRGIPIDPFTKSSETWVLVYEGEEEGEDGGGDFFTEEGFFEGEEPGIVDVHSGSELVSISGEPLSEW